MANDESVFREVEEELAADRQWAFFRKNGVLLIGGAVALVAAVAGWQIWTAQKGATAGKAATEYAATLKATDESPEEAAATLKAFADGAPDGYAVLAELRRAGLLAIEGDREGALEAYRAAYNDAAAPTRLRELARLRAAYLSLADGRAAAHADLGALIEETSPFGFYAREISGLAAIEAAEYADAEDIFKRLAEGEGAPEPIRVRAEEFAALAAAGKAGVNIKGEARVEDLMRALDAAAPSEASEGAAPTSALQDIEAAIDQLAPGDAPAEPIDDAGAPEEDE